MKADQILYSRKLRPIGHGIDLADFPCVDRSGHRQPLHVLSLGRTSPAYLSLKDPLSVDDVSSVWPVA